MSDTLAAVNADDRCACGQSYAWHLEHNVHHPFTSQDERKDFLRPRRDRDTRNGVRTPQRGAERPPTTVVDAPWPFDPVLRQALIDKGVLTPEDLRNAEAKIRAVSAMFHQGGQGEGQVQE